MLNAADLVTLKFNGLKNFGRLPAIPELFMAFHGANKVDA